MMEQEQFLDVIDRDEAQRRFREAIRCEPLGAEPVPLSAALGRVLAEDVIAPVDVPSFDRSNVDGVAVIAADTFGAHEEGPRRLRWLDERITTGAVSKTTLRRGTAIAIATGGMLPRGADGVVMIEHVDVQDDEVLVRRAVTPGQHVSFAGTDVAAGETVLRRGETITSRESGVLAAIGLDRISVWRRPRVGVISTGDEIIPPGQPMRPAMIYDSNARIIADAVSELGGQPIELGIVRDDLETLRTTLRSAVDSCDVVVLSGGTSKGQGDLCYRVVRELSGPGIVAHGVALKPGKPVCLAATGGKPVVVLPGFPTSAIFTFHEFVAPVIRRMAGRPPESQTTVPASMAVRVNSEIGRTEYLLVGLVERIGGTANEQATYAAYPMGKGSGSVTTFSRADGFVTIGRHEELVESGQQVAVQLLGRDLRPVDLVVIGSHCVGLDFLLGRMHDLGFRTKFMAVGSSGGLDAVQRGQCDLAGIHLLDPETDSYNTPWVTPEIEWIAGYTRQQGVLFRRGDDRFEQRAGDEAIAAVADDPECVMVNRNRGSGTRILIDRLLGGKQPPGYAVQSRSHNAVAAAVVQGRADWGVAIRNVADRAELGFLPITGEQFDFVVPKSRRDRPAVIAFCELLQQPAVREQLRGMGFAPP